jgi:DNA-directed RNA polymerase specialized sigma subunit
MSNLGHDIAVEQAVEALAEELGREPTADEVTEYLADREPYADEYGERNNAQV